MRLVTQLRRAPMVIGDPPGPRPGPSRKMRKDARYGRATGSPASLGASQNRANNARSRIASSHRPKSGSGNSELDPRKIAPSDRCAQAWFATVARHVVPIRGRRGTPAVAGVRDGGATRRARLGVGSCVGLLRSAVRRRGASGDGCAGETEEEGAHDGRRIRIHVLPAASSCSAVADARYGQSATWPRQKLMQAWLPSARTWLAQRLASITSFCICWRVAPAREKPPSMTGRRYAFSPASLT